MSQAVSEYVNYIKENGERVERAVELQEGTAAVTPHNPETGPEDASAKARRTGRAAAGDRCYRLAVACVLLLCFLLLIATTAVWIELSLLNAEKDQLQATYSTLIITRDQLQTQYSNLIAERNQLRTSNVQVMFERNHLQDRNRNLTMESEQQQDRIEKLQSRLNTLEPQGGLGWTRYGTSDYYFPEKKTWNESRQDCISRGADLVVITSQEEQNFINQQLGNSMRAWIGLSDRDKENTWKWVDGTPLTTWFWHTNEPNNVGDEDCAEVFIPEVVIPKCWNDKKCSDKSHWICEKNNEIV